MNKNGIIFALSLIIIGVIGVFVTGKDYMSKVDVEGGESYSGTNIQHIVIDNEVANLRILPTTSDQIEVKWHGSILKRYFNQDTISLEETDSSLRINTSEVFGMLKFQLFDINFNSFTVEVYLPEKQFASLDIDSNVGEITINSINSNTIEVSSDVSNIKLEKVNAETIEAISSVGSIILNDIVGKVYARSDVGTISLKMEQITNDMEIITNVGDIDLNVAAVPNNTTFIGNSELGSVKTFGNKGDYVSKPANFVVEMETTIGDINVTSKK